MKGSGADTKVEYFSSVISWNSNGHSTTYVQKK
jgi:hypothetical protein